MNFDRICWQLCHIHKIPRERAKKKCCEMLLKYLYWNQTNFFFLFEFITVARSSMEISKANFIQNVGTAFFDSSTFHLQSFLLLVEWNIENASLHINVLFLVVCECVSFLCYCVHFISLWLSFRLMYIRDLLHTVNHASFKPYVKPKVNSHIM